MQHRQTSRVKVIAIRRKKPAMLPLIITTVFFAVLGISLFIRA